MMHPLEIAAAVIIDFLAGDPRRLPHPVRWIGSFTTRVEQVARKAVRNEYLAGGIAWMVVVGVSTSLSWIVIEAAGRIFPPAAVILRIVILYYTIATRDLIVHSSRVYDRLIADDLDGARAAVGMIVSRETTDAGRDEVIRAAVESVSENTSDATIAPLLFAALAGPVAAMAYRTINTLDAMFGYRNDRYLRFGRVPARADDIANFLPARIAGVLTCIAAPLAGLDGIRSFTTLIRDAKKHDSPNAGYPEAAAAGALGLAFGGPTRYFGRTVDKPIIGRPILPFKAQRIREANRLAVTTVILATGLSIAARYLMCFLFS